MQNTSHAVMAQRSEPRNAPDDFPTPPWATRALCEHVLHRPASLQDKHCLEPACGAGHMALNLTTLIDLVWAYRSCSPSNPDPSESHKIYNFGSRYLSASGAGQQR